MTTSVLVLGAGFGGLELSSRLAHELGDQVEITLIDRADAFVFGFSKLDVMFGRRTPEAVRLPYRDLATPGVRFRRETITAIDPEPRRVVTDRGTYEADVLVVALGADYDLAATPGLAEAGREFYSVAGARALRDVLPSFRTGTAIVGVCGAPFKCPPAPSEAAFLLDEHLRERNVRDATQIQVVIPFGTPVPPSPATSEAILARFAERGIEFVRDRRVAALDPATHEAVLDDGNRLPFDLFLGIPVHRAPAVVEASGLAEGGWIPVDPATLATRFPGVYAVGDVTSVGTPKAGVFSEGAARVVADQLVARIRGESEPPGYDGTGSCWIELGDNEVGRVDVDFFSTPGRPTGTFTTPSASTALEKAEFGASRRARWFGIVPG
jgi:sulfide:quinone oxidoreductase